MGHVLRLGKGLVVKRGMGGWLARCEARFKYRRCPLFLVVVSNPRWISLASVPPCEARENIKGNNQRLADKRDEEPSAGDELGGRFATKVDTK